MVISSKPQAASRFPADFQILQIFRKLQFFQEIKAPHPTSDQNFPLTQEKSFPSTGSQAEIARNMWFPVSDLRLKSATWAGSERRRPRVFQNSWKVAHVTTAPCCLRLNIFFRTFISRDFRRARVSDWPYFVMNLNYSNNILILAYFSPSIRFFLY